MRWFMKVVTVIMCDTMRADEGDLVSEELRKRAAHTEKCDLAVVCISERIPHLRIYHVDNANRYSPVTVYQAAPFHSRKI